MKRSKAVSRISKFFKDKRGRWTIIQSPNALLLAWILLLFVNFFVDSRPLMLLQSAVLFAWAYLELTQGDSYFRRMLGAVFLVSVVVGYFV